MNKIDSPLLNKFDPYNPSPDSINQILLIIQMDTNFEKLNDIDKNEATRLYGLYTYKFNSWIETIVLKDGFQFVFY